jgi:hypothetical protein
MPAFRTFPRQRNDVVMLPIGRWDEVDIGHRLVAVSAGKPATPRFDNNSGA